MIHLDDEIHECHGKYYYYQDKATKCCFFSYRLPIFYPCIDECGDCITNIKDITDDPRSNRYLFLTTDKNTQFMISIRHIERGWKNISAIADWLKNETHTDVPFDFILTCPFLNLYSDSTMKRYRRYLELGY